jgi:hypothetical protein
MNLVWWYAECAICGIRFAGRDSAPVEEHQQKVHPDGIREIVSSVWRNRKTGQVATVIDVAENGSIQLGAVGDSQNPAGYRQTVESLVRLRDEWERRVPGWIAQDPSPKL